MLSFGRDYVEADHLNPSPEGAVLVCLHSLGLSLYVVLPAFLGSRSSGLP